jgi:hypothetical protein
MITVVNHRSSGRQRPEMEGRYVYCGRPSKWGNPFRLRDRSEAERAKVIQQFRAYWYAPEQVHLRLAALKEIPTNAALGCFCAPLPCHCDVIAEYINAERY